MRQLLVCISMQGLSSLYIPNTPEDMSVRFILEMNPKISNAVPKQTDSQKSGSWWEGYHTIYFTFGMGSLLLCPLPEKI